MLRAEVENSTATMKVSEIGEVTKSNFKSKFSYIFLIDCDLLSLVMLLTKNSLSIDQVVIFIRQLLS